jgi:hypothetical protein
MDVLLALNITEPYGQRKYTKSEYNVKSLRLRSNLVINQRHSTSVVSKYHMYVTQLYNMCVCVWGGGGGRGWPE